MVGGGARQELGNVETLSAEQLAAMPPEQAKLAKKMRRKIRNRESAQSSRERHRAYVARIEREHKAMSQQLADLSTALRRPCVTCGTVAQHGDGGDGDGDGDGDDEEDGDGFLQPRMSVAAPGSDSGGGTDTSVRMDDDPAGMGAVHHQRCNELARAGRRGGAAGDGGCTPEAAEGSNGSAACTGSRRHHHHHQQHRHHHDPRLRRQQHSVDSTGMSCSNGAAASGAGSGSGSGSGSESDSCSTTPNCQCMHCSAVQSLCQISAVQSLCQISAAAAVATTTTTTTTTNNTAAAVPCWGSTSTSGSGSASSSAAIAIAAAAQAAEGQEAAMAS